MMKKIISVFAIFMLMCLTTSLFAQDTLYMKSGDIIASKILEVGSSEIKYKRSDNIEGPTFVINASDISVIKYKNGHTDTIKVAKVIEPSTIVMPTDLYPPIYRKGPFYKQGYRRMKEKEMQNIVRMVHDPEIDLHIKKAKTDKAVAYLGFVAIPAVVFGVGYTFVSWLNELDGGSTMNYGPGIACGVVCVAAITTSITFKALRKKHNNAAIKLFNEKY